MSIIRPASFDYPLSYEALVISPGVVIDEDGEQGRMVERVHRLYADACRCPILHLSVLGLGQQRTGTSAVWSAYHRFRLGDDFSAMSVVAYGADMDLIVNVYNDSLVLQAGTGTLSIVGSAAEVTGAITGLSVTSGYIRYSLAANVTAASLFYLRVLPDVIAAAALPT